mmetsp:Transcript_44659/g.69875  ORF Transcript_44659/g.69875 Transcript_44659/m.69875 type:complete len:433 (+) Transcript_44659:376-1674(+)
MALVDIVESVGRGRDYVAKKDLVKGQVMFTARPVAAALRFEHLRSHCSGCFCPVDIDTCEAAFICEDCGLWTLCDTCCGGQAVADRKPKEDTIGFEYLKLHLQSKECATIQKGDAQDTTTRIILQMMQTYRQEVASTAKDVNDLGAPTGVQGLATLEGHEETRDETAIVAYLGFVQDVFSVLVEEGRELSDYLSNEEVATAVHWLHVLQHNQHAITCDFTGEMVGCMISPEGSLFNHNCRPNTIWVTGAGGVIKFVAAENVKKGTAMCISYLHEHTPVAIRNQVLRNRYKFDCSCGRCNDSEEDKLLDILGKDDKDNLVEKNESATRVVVNNEILDLAEILDEWLNQRLAGSSAESTDGDGVTLETASEKIGELERAANREGLSTTHWSILRFHVAAGDLLLSLGNPSEAVQHFKTVIDNSPDIKPYHTKVN